MTLNNTHLSTLHSFERRATAAGLLGVWPVVPPFWVVADVMALIFRLMVKSSYRYWTFICPLCVATWSAMAALLLATLKMRERKKKPGGKWKDKFL